MSNIFEQMVLSCKEGNKPEGASNAKAWKKRIDLVLEEHKVLKSVQGNVHQPDYNDPTGK